jgi:cysteine desulfurase
MIYFDNNATTQPTKRVVEAMLPYLTERYFNASASTSVFTGVDKPRSEAAVAMAKLVNAEEPDCFAFTSGATESNNWVLSSFAKTAKTGRVVISAVEHASVSEPSAELGRGGFELVEVPVDADGVIRLEALRDALTEDTALVSIIAASNETGVLQPIANIGRLIRECCPAALFHTDATQAVGKTTVDLQGDWQDVDLLSFSAHKFHGPKGIGGLYIRPGVRLEPMLLGGGQERGLRSGTINTFGLAGLAASATEAIEVDVQVIRRLRDYFEDELGRSQPAVVIHSHDAPRLPNTSCFSMPGLVGEDVVQCLASHGIIIGTGSACSSGSIDPSRTLRAMSVSHEMARSAVRVSLSVLSTHEEVALLLDGVRSYCMAGPSRVAVAC